MSTSSHQFLLGILRGRHDGSLKAGWKRVVLDGINNPPVNKRELSTRENGETALSSARWAGFTVTPQACELQLENVEGDEEVAEC